MHHVTLQPKKMTIESGYGQPQVLTRPTVGELLDVFRLPVELKDKFRLSHLLTLLDVPDTSLLNAASGQDVGALLRVFQQEDGIDVISEWDTLCVAAELDQGILTYDVYCRGADPWDRYEINARDPGALFCLPVWVDPKLHVPLADLHVPFRFTLQHLVTALTGALDAAGLGSWQTDWRRTGPARA